MNESLFVFSKTGCVPFCKRCRASLGLCLVGARVKDPVLDNAILCWVLSKGWRTGRAQAVLGMRVAWGQAREYDAAPVFPQQQQVAGGALAWKEWQILPVRVALVTCGVMQRHR